MYWMHKNSNIPDQKRKSSHHIAIKTLNIQNKERIIEASREKYQVINIERPISNIPDFPMETLNAIRAWT